MGGNLALVQEGDLITIDAETQPAQRGRVGRGTGTAPAGLECTGAEVYEGRAVQVYEERSLSVRRLCYRRVK